MIGPERIYRGGLPIAGLESLFFPGGAPIALLGLVWSDSLPLSGAVPQVYRAGGAPYPPTLPIITLTPSGPIGGFFVGSSGAPVGVDIFGGGGLPIGPAPPIARFIAAEQARTALVTIPAVLFGGAGVAPIGAVSLGVAGGPISATSIGGGPGALHLGGGALGGHTFGGLSPDGLLLIG